MMKSFLDDQKVKDKYLARVHSHRLVDELVKGKTGENGKGCAVWCTLDKYDHKSYESELGIPEWLARIEDCIFEGLPDKRSQMWPEEFLKAIPIGKDLETLKAPFMIFILEFALENFDHKKFPDVKSAIDTVIKGWREGWTDESARCAADAAYAAGYAADAARSAAYAARCAADAAYAAGCAADAAYAAGYAADAAGYAAYAAGYAADAARSAAGYAANAAYAADAAGYAAGYAADAADAAYVRFADKLLELLQSA